MILNRIIILVISCILLCSCVKTPYPVYITFKVPIPSELTTVPSYKPINNIDKLSIKKLHAEILNFEYTRNLCVLNQHTILDIVDEYNSLIADQ